MLLIKPYKLLLFVIVTLGLTHEPEITASNLTPQQIFLASGVIGALHGYFNKIHLKVIKENPADYQFFYFFTYLLARAFQKGMLGKMSDNDSKYFLSLLGHGLGQSLIESYDPDKRNFSGLGMNFTLVEAALAANL
jgi:hypothetical protein